MYRQGVLHLVQIGRVACWNMEEIATELPNMS